MVRCYGVELHDFVVDGPYRTQFVMASTGGDDHDIDRRYPHRLVA